MFRKNFLFVFFIFTTVNSELYFVEYRLLVLLSLKIYKKELYFSISAIKNHLLEKCYL